MCLSCVHSNCHPNFDEACNRTYVYDPLDLLTPLFGVDSQSRIDSRVGFDGTNDGVE